MKHLFTTLILLICNVSLTCAGETVKIWEKVEIEFESKTGYKI